MIKNVILPRHLFHGIQGLKGGTPSDHRMMIFGGDTETVHGKPHTLQLVGPDDFTFDFVTAETIFPVMWRWLRARAVYDGLNICYWHRLNFDLRVIFSAYHLPMYDQFNDIKLEIKIPGEKVPVKVKMLFGRVNKATLIQGRVKIELFDSWAFTAGSLSRALKMFHIPEGKLPRPEGLGERPLDSVEFKRYAMQDAIVERALALKIIEVHRVYDCRPCITLPSFAARVFRGKFLGPTETIPFPPEKVIRAAELSYHGGKNGYYLDAPTVLEDVYEVDISSAYPYAMRELPGLTAGKYRRVRMVHAKRCGIYKVSGRTDAAPYPLIFDHDFKPIPCDTNFSDLWVTGFEMERVLKSGIRVDAIDGFIWEPAKGSINPFRRYVNHFYDKKQASDVSDPLYGFYKLALNALYGKLVGTVEIRSQAGVEEVAALREEGVKIPEGFTINERWDPVHEKYMAIIGGWRAGSMYNPFWASQITGFTRAYLYDLETKLDAVHSATDSVKALRPHDSVEGLGGLKVECFGRCYLFRNKLYLHCSYDFEYCGHKKPPFKYPENHKRAGKPLVDSDGQHLCKVALHGFKGHIWELWEARHRLIKCGFMEYEYTHCVGLREGLRRREQPTDFVTREETLTL